MRICQMNEAGKDFRGKKGKDMMARTSKHMGIIKVGKPKVQIKCGSGRERKCIVGSLLDLTRG